MVPETVTPGLSRSFAPARQLTVIRTKEEGRRVTAGREVVGTEVKPFTLDPSGPSGRDPLVTVTITVPMPIRGGAGRIGTDTRTPLQDQEGTSRWRRQRILVEVQRIRGKCGSMTSPIPW